MFLKTFVSAKAEISAASRQIWLWRLPGDAGVRVATTESSNLTFAGFKPSF